MSYTVTFWSFAKKDNSTKQPTGAGTSYVCDIADSSGILSPTIKLHTSFTNPSSYTYAQISDFSRYYFVSNWRYDRGLWWADLVEDVLATYKSSIGNLSMYVLRSSYAMDGRVVDEKYPIKTGTYKSVQQKSNPFAVDVSSGYFIVGIINNDSSAIGVVSYYCFTSTQFRAFASFLLGNSSFLNSPPEISDSLLKCLVNPTQYIASCIWVPFTPPMQVGSVTTIPIGWWSLSGTGISCQRLSGYSRFEAGSNISVPKHPDALTRGYYLLQEPYSQYYLDFPPFGAITIPANDLVDVDTLSYSIAVDCITGKGRIDIGPNITQMHAQIGVPVALAQNSPDLASAIQTPTSSGSRGIGSVNGQIVNHLNPQVTQGNTALGRAINSAAGTIERWWNNSGVPGTASNIISAAVGSQLPVQVIGGNGGFMAGYYPIKLILTYGVLAPDNNTEWGRPLCQTKQLSTIPGYILCADTDFEISCTESERSAIAGFLTGGFFYE